MRRDNSFKEIRYEEKARFDIKYQREGYIVAERSFDFVRLSSRFLTLKYNRNTWRDYFDRRQTERETS